MREQFDKELAELRGELVSIYAALDLLLHDVVDAFIKNKPDVAKIAINKTFELDHRCNDLEQASYNQIALQSPVATDLRLLQFIIYSSFILDHICNHIRGIAKMVKNLPEKPFSASFTDLLDAQAHLVYRVMGASIRCVVENDLIEASSLPELDEPVNQIYKSYYRNFSRLQNRDDLKVAGTILLAARLLERIADYAVEVGERLVYLLTGNHVHLSELGELNEDDVEDLYVGTTPSFLRENNKIENVAQQVPEMEAIEAEAQGEDISHVAREIEQALKLARKIAEHKHENILHLLDSMKDSKTSHTQERSKKAARVSDEKQTTRKKPSTKKASSATSAKRNTRTPAKKTASKTSKKQTQ